jgi:DNA polymerase-3 subunit epsilon
MAQDDSNRRRFQRMLAPTAEADITPGGEAPGGDAREAPAERNGTLLRRARDVLIERGEPVTAEELAAGVFGLAGQQPLVVKPWMTLLDQLLGASSLFACDEAGLWRLTAWDARILPLEEIEFVALDVESTGLAPGRHRLIEVAAVIVRNGEPGAQYQHLINPSRAIPQFITQFTGITPSMVKRAPPASRVLPKLREFIGGRPVVGHNVGFDLGFLNYEADHCGLGDTFPLEGVDTIALARRYLTGMRRARLDRVAAALHIPVHARHRALPDALLVAQIFAILLARAREEGCRTLDDLWNVMAGIAPAKSALPPNRPTGKLYLNPAWRQSFPTRPGVYLMKDETGEVIYVGKAKNLRDRLASYYSQPLGYTRKMDGLLQSVREIETRVLGSELEALLVESHLIKLLQPRYNVQLRNYELYPFIKVDVQHQYPRFYATREVSADGARYFGPFRSSRIVNATLELIEKVFPVRTCTRGLPPHARPSEPCLRYHLKRCPGPCRGLLDERAEAQYRAAVAEACAFLGGEREDLIERLKQDMFVAAARQDYERAARLRDALRDADQVLLGQRLVTGAVEANNLLIVYPSAEEASVEIFLVRHGRLIAQRRVAAEEDALRVEVGALVAEARGLGTPPSRVGREEVDQINIIARWIHRHSEDDERAFFRLPRQAEDAAETGDFAARVAERVLAGLLERADESLVDEDEPLPVVAEPE